MSNELQLDLSGKVKESEQAILKALETLDLKISRPALNMPGYSLPTNMENLNRNTHPTEWQKSTECCAGAEGHEASREARLLLQSLYFRAMEVRHAQIRKSHKQTFRWVFEDNASPFCRWLRNDGEIFWISGKAGSGKSTLMKLISDDPKTQELLRQWSGSRELIIAKHFFWKPGEELQKSQDGLLRSILYDVLKQCPELIPAVLEALPHRSFETWYTHELLDAFASLSRTAPTSFRLCLIIDGLDEYESSKGCHLEQLIEVVSTLSKQTWTKICVSSRPWNIFRDAFGFDRNCWLKLEDLTREDIETYVQDKLDLSLSKDESRRQLVRLIAKKAEGVFFWVYLAVRDLLEGIRDGDRLRDLFRKVDGFPPDLEEFLQCILASIDPAHQQEAEKHFQLAFHGLDGRNDTYHRLPLLIHTFVGEIENLETFDHFLATSSWDEEAFESRLENGRRRLASRCKGLLETSESVSITESEDMYTPLWSPTVCFFHRSVVELISNTHASKFDKFDSSAFICKAYNVMLDIAHQSQDRKIKIIYSKLVRDLVYDMIASAIHAENRFHQFSKEMAHWMKQADAIIMQRSDYEVFDLIPRPLDPLPNMIFLEECACSGFVSYVQLILAEHPQPRQLSLRLLHVLNWYEPLKHGWNIGGDMYGMRDLLLDQLGGDVNLICPHCSGSSMRSVWACILTPVRRDSILARDPGRESRFLQNWARIFNMYLQRCNNALHHIVPFDEHPKLASLEEENPKGGLTARTILQRYIPRECLQEMGIESLDSEGQKYKTLVYRKWSQPAGVIEQYPRHI